MTLKPWPLATTAAKLADAGVVGITVWRQALEGVGAAEAGRIVRDAGLEVVSLCRGGFFPSVDPARRRDALDDNRRAIDEAAALGAPMVVLVCGADPAQSLGDSRAQIEAGVGSLLDHARDANVRLTIEPLHPMYADTRSAINTIAQAMDICDRLDSPQLGVAVDVYHLWWDPNLGRDIERCARAKKLWAFHICDWLTPTVDMLNDRGLMGEGCIDIRGVRAMVERGGFDGFHEVEIFSDRWWSGDQDRFLAEIIRAYRECS
jgi:sugar phosphate isomerase/epimerase